MIKVLNYLYCINRLPGWGHRHYLPFPNLPNPRLWLEQIFYWLQGLLCGTLPSIKNNIFTNQLDYTLLLCGLFSTLLVIITLTWAFSWTFLPFSLRTHACVSKSTVSTWMVKVVLILLLVEDPVADSDWTFLMVVDLSRLPTVIRLYACHMSSFSSGTNATYLKVTHHT